MKSNNSYFAGIIDGEGCLTALILKKPWGIRIRFVVVNTDKRLLRWLVKNFSGKIYNHTSANTKIKHPNSKTVYCWCPPVKDMKTLLIMLKENLIIKRMQADILLQIINIQYNRKSRLCLAGRKGSTTPYTKNERNKLEKLVNKLHILNKRGR